MKVPYKNMTLFVVRVVCNLVCKVKVSQLYCDVIQFWGRYNLSLCAQKKLRVEDGQNWGSTVWGVGQYIVDIAPVVVGGRHVSEASLSVWVQIVSEHYLWELSHKWPMYCSPIHCMVVYCKRSLIGMSNRICTLSIGSRPKFKREIWENMPIWLLFWEMNLIVPLFVKMCFSRFLDWYTLMAR